MPAFCTHYLFSQELKPWAEENANFKYIENVVNLGTQGPDIFFFKRLLPVFMPGKAGMKIGSSLHKSQIEKILSAFAEYSKDNDNHIAKSYVYGFIMHYVLDKNCHPFVYAKVEEILDEDKHIHSSSAHNKVEMFLDSYMMYQKKNIENVKTFDTAKTIELTEEEKTEVGKIVAYVVKKVLDKDITAKDVVFAIDDTVKFQNILRDKSGRFCGFITGVETVVAPAVKYIKLSSYFRPKDWKKGIEYANINNSVWASPYDRIERTSSFEELFTVAVDDAKKLINNFEDYCAGNREDFGTHNISFLTGLEVL